MNQFPTDAVRGRLDQWRQISFILFDLGAMNLIAGAGAAFFYSNPLLLLGFTRSSVWLGLFFLLAGLFTWKVHRLPAIVPLLIIIVDLWNTVRILPLYERAGYVVLVQISFVLPLLFMLLSILRAQIKRVSSGVSYYEIPSSSGPIRSGNEAIALMSSMLVSVGTGLAVLLLFSKYAVNQIAEATNPFINIFHDFLLVPLLLLLFPMGAALGELVWLRASRLYLSGYELSDFVRYLKQFPPVSRVAERMLRDQIKAENSGWPNSRQHKFSAVATICTQTTSLDRSRLHWFAPLILMLLLSGLAVVWVFQNFEMSSRVTAEEETPPAPGTLVVSQSGCGHFRTIGEALTAAEPGRMILVRAGVYQENLLIDRPVTLSGDENAAGGVILECADDVCLKIDADGVTIRNLRVNGRVGFWRSLFRQAEATAIAVLSGQVLIENCDISSNSGAGIIVSAPTSAAHIKNAKIHDCLLNGLRFTDQSQGIVADSEIYQTGWAAIRSDNKSKPIVVRSRIHHSRMDGVLITEQGAGTFEDCEFFENAHSAIHVREASSIIVNRSKVYSQRQVGIFVHDAQSSTRVEECEIFGNAYSGIEVADQGDAYVVKSKLHHGKSVGITAWRNGSVTVEESLIFENAATGLLFRGAGRTVVRKSVFRANSYSGIEVANGSDPQIDHCQIFGGRGTGISFHENAKGRVEDCSIFGNMNANVAITSGSNPEIHNSRFSESGQAGLLISGGLGIITDCKIVNNYVGVEIKENGAPTIQHCQINANRSQGLLAESASAGSITSSDLSRNSGGPWKIESGSQLVRNHNVE